MKICGLQKLSLLDYPGYTAATVFTGGCNLRCPFCHNALLVTADTFEEAISEKDFFIFLKKRTKLLDGVCITGGEPLIHPEITEFIKSIKSLGFKVKLDTNGCFPEKLEQLLNSELIDYVAMDIKNSPEKYPVTVGIEGFDTAPILKSIHIIMNSSVPYEFRTTLIKQFHTTEDIERISEIIKGSQNYFLQTFVDSGRLISGGLSGFSRDETEKIVKKIFFNIKNTQIRGQ